MKLPMKALSVKKLTTYIVETDADEWPTFERSECGTWNRLIGESCEPVYTDSVDLETAYQQFIQQPRPKPWNLKNEKTNNQPSNFCHLWRDSWLIRFTADNVAILVFVVPVDGSANQ